MSHAHQDEPNFTVHVWLSFGGLIKSSDLREDENDLGTEEKVQALTAQFYNGLAELEIHTNLPIMVMLNPHVKFNGCVGSKTEILSQRVLDKLRASGIACQNNANPWVALWICGKDHYVRTVEERHKRQIWALIEKILFQQKVLLLCSLDEKHVTSANQLLDQGISGLVDKDRVNVITSTPDLGLRKRNHEQGESVVTIKDAQEELEELRKTMKEVQERMEKQGERVGYVTTEMSRVHIELASHIPQTWGRTDMDDDDCKIVCPTCRTNKDARYHNTKNETWCLFCCANSQAQFRQEKAYSTDERRSENVQLLARVRNYFEKNNIDLLDFANKDPLDELVRLTYHMVGGQTYGGEKIMKAISGIGEVRMDPALAEQMCNRGRLKQGVVSIESEYDETEKRKVFYYRLGYDMGNACYADFFDKMTYDKNLALATIMYGASAEKKGDVIEMWLGIIDLCNQSRNIQGLELTTGGFDVNALYVGLERALEVFATSTRSSITLNNKRGNTPDYWLQHEESLEITRLMAMMKGGPLRLITPEELKMADCVHVPIHRMDLNPRKSLMSTCSFIKSTRQISPSWNQ